MDNDEHGNDKEESDKERNVQKGGWVGQRKYEKKYK